MIFSLAAAPEIDYFVGRASELSLIESILLPLTTAERRTVVLHGLGGIGKSQLAIEFAKKHRSDYTAVLWLNAKTEETSKQSFAANARRLPKNYINQETLYGPQNEEVLGNILREMKAWLDLPGNHRWLLIYDNVDNPKIPDNEDPDAYDIRLYFPAAHQGSILVTTRWKSLRLGRLLEVAKLSKDEESISLLEQTSGRSIGQGDFSNQGTSNQKLRLRIDFGTKEMLKKLDGLPLALATAGAYLGLTSMSASEYIHHHDTSWLELQRTSPKLLSYEDRTIYSTWNLSYMHIRKEDESAAKLLELWAYFDNQDLWYDLLKAGDDDDAPAWFHRMVGTKLAFHTAIGKLQKHALIESLTDSDGYAMHHCVHAWVTNVLGTATDDQGMRLALTCVGDSIPIKPARGDWITRQRLTSHSERCLQLLRVWTDENKDSKEIEVHVTRFFRFLGILYADQGKLKEAESMFQRALTGIEKVFGPDHTSTLDIVNNIGALYYERGQLTEAESMYQRALIGKENVLGSDHASTLITVNNLAMLYAEQGNLTEAESMYQRALIGKENVLGSDHVSTLDTINNLGMLYGEQGKLTEAESMYQRALIGFEEHLGYDHETTSNVFRNLGFLYQNQGKLTDAELIYQRALVGYTRNPPPDPKSQLYLYYRMGLLSRDLQNFERAKRYFNKAYQGSQTLLGPTNDETIDALYQFNREVERGKQGAESSSTHGDAVGDG